MRAHKVLSRTVGVLLLAVGVIGFTSQFNLAEAVLDQPAQDEFVPLDSVPPEDQLPAAPLLVAAYALLWIAVVGYLWSIWRRMVAVERDLSDLSGTTGES